MRGADDAFDGEEVERLELLANQLAIAIQNARDYREKLEQAIRDPLTGVYNRRFFFEALEKEAARRVRYGSPVSLVIFDIDDFKAINDTFGHAVGDDALRKVTEIATGLIRPIDSFARLGGEEFGLLLPETQQLDALLVADRLRAAVARQEVIPGRRVTLSGGVASCPQDAVTSEDLEQRADAALYWAKRNGKNICAVASEVTTDEDGAGDEVEASLSHLYALVSTIDAEPLHTRDHSENVAAYAVALGQELGLSEERVVKLRRAAFFHDIGKIAVSRSTLAKPGPLDDAEWEEIRIHPGVGSTMLAARRPARRGEVGRPAPRARGRPRLPQRLAGRGDRSRGAHHLRGRRVRGDDLRPALQGGHGGRRRHRRAARVLRHAVRRPGGRRHGRAAGARRAHRACVARRMMSRSAR